jgi:hypothetical protein
MACKGLKSLTYHYEERGHESNPPRMRFLVIDAALQMQKHSLETLSLDANTADVTQDRPFGSLQCFERLATVELPVTALIGEKVSENIKLVDVLPTSLRSLTITGGPQTEYIDGDLWELADLCPRRFPGLAKIELDTIQRLSADYKALDDAFTCSSVTFIYQGEPQIP